MNDLKILAKDTFASGDILTLDALQFLRELHHHFDQRRLELLQLRKERQRQLTKGIQFGFLSSTASVRSGSWQVAEAPLDLQKRHVEITGPAEPKMMTNALNSGADVFMADIEDALSPTWSNVIQAQVCLRQAVRRTLRFNSPEGKAYQLKPLIATLLVRPRGWHLSEKHVEIGGTSISASLFDFGLYFFHNAHELLRRETGPYFYLPKMESHLEARLWNDVFLFAQDYVKIPRGKIRATVLIETIPAAFEMEEILFELKDHISGLNAGRWDYLFSMIKKMSFNEAFTFPDRAQLTMTVPFMRSYTQLLVQTCHRRKSHAIGGMAAFVPSRRDSEVNAVAFKKVQEDKMREAQDGFDGTWVAHPDLVSVAREMFVNVLGTQPHQKQRIESTRISSEALLPQVVAGGEQTEAGFRLNINVSLQYLDWWLRGSGAVAINNLMEDAATAEISRAELWQWLHRSVKLTNGEIVTPEYFAQCLQQELSSLNPSPQNRLSDAANLLHELVMQKEFPEFLTTPAYDILERTAHDS